MKPVCLVIGAGAGIGGNIGKRFAKHQVQREAIHVRMAFGKDFQGLIAQFVIGFYQVE